MTGLLTIKLSALMYKNMNDDKTCEKLKFVNSNKQPLGNKNL